MCRLTGACRHVKGGLGAGAVFHKKKHHGLAFERRHLLDRAAVDFLEAGGQIQYMQRVLPAQLGDVQQIFVRPVIAIVGIHGRGPSRLKKNPAGVNGENGNKQHAGPEMQKHPAVSACFGLGPEISGRCAANGSIWKMLGARQVFVKKKVC